MTQNTHKYNPHEDTPTKHYINMNVYQAAKQRIKEAITLSDNQAVLCSGGKDSLTVLYLLMECYKELNRQQKINVIFMDEELIHQDIITAMQSLKEDPNINLYWFSIPLECQKYNCGEIKEYYQNDPRRKKHVTNPPDYAITLETLGLPSNTRFTRYQLADLQASLFKGKVCLFKGIRCEESLFRLTQVLRRPNHPSIGQITKKHFECIPIYDWSQKDVFLYYYKNNHKYNPIYDKQMWSQTPLRVSTPLHQYNRRQYTKLRSMDPELYDKITEVFPDMAHADRYNNDITTTKNPPFNKYPHTIYGVMQYIDDCYPEKQENHKVKKQVLWAYKRREQLKKQKHSNKLGGYPLYYLMQTIQRGATMRNIIPCDRPTLKMYQYEGYTEKDYITDKNHRREWYEHRKNKQTTHR